MKKATQILFKILFIIVILLNCCLSFADEKEDKKLYLQWLSTCKNYKDVGNWLAENFTYDKQKLKLILNRRDPNQPRTTEFYKPWTTFAKKGGVCTDAAYFAKYSLNKINSNYKADIIFLFDGKKPIGHYVAGFFLWEKQYKLYVMDYGTSKDSKQRGTWGPFNDLDEYVDTVYLKLSHRKRLAGWHFGWNTQEEREIGFSNISNKDIQFNKVTGKYEIMD